MDIDTEHAEPHVTALSMDAEPSALATSTQVGTPLAIAPEDDATCECLSVEADREIIDRAASALLPRSPPSVVRSPLAIGAHVTSDKGPVAALQTALNSRTTAFAFFLAPKNQWLNSFISDAQIRKFLTEREAAHIPASAVVPHSHLFNNLASAGQLHRVNSMQCLRNELRDCERLGIPHIVLHPGSAGKQHPREDGFVNCIAGLNALIAETRKTCILLENSAGQGHSIGCTIPRWAAAP
jgi:hypothetical protein